MDPPFNSAALLSCALQDVVSARATLSAPTCFMLPFCCVISEGLAFRGAHYAACIHFGCHCAVECVFFVILLGFFGCQCSHRTPRGWARDMYDTLDCALSFAVRGCHPPTPPPLFAGRHCQAAHISIPTGRHSHHKKRGVKNKGKKSHPPALEESGGLLIANLSPRL